MTDPEETAPEDAESNSEAVARGRGQQELGEHSHGDNALLRRLGPDRQPPAVIAHRGYSAVVPENTLTAFEAAILAGAEWIESDVRTTADGAMVLLHDKSVDRTTDGTGKVAELTEQQVARLDNGVMFSDTHRACRVPTLQELLDLLAARSEPHLLLEVKGGQTPDDMARILTAISAAGMTHRTLVQSFSRKLVRAAIELEAELAPGVRVGLLRERFDDDPVTVAKELGVVAYNPEYPAVLEEPGKVSVLHDAGVAVLPWTSDSPQEWARLERAGVDGVITNRPANLVGWLAHWHTSPGEA